MQRRQLFAGLVLIAIVSGRSTVSEAGSTIYVGQRTSARTSFNDIDHSAWNSLLRKYVDKDGYVDYTGWHASNADRKSLSRYLANLSTANPVAKSTKDAKLAFWINAYNAVTVHGILREYPTTSIRNHTAKFLGYNIWNDLQLYVGGKAYSLDSIEHKILRKLNEPRIHFAIVCASIGCPRLLNQAYTAQDVQKQLDVNAKDFFSRSQNFRYSSSSSTFQLSQILNWFGEDFGPNQSAQLKTIAKWLPTAAAQNAARKGTGSMSFMTYDWKLNDSKTRRKVARR